MLCMIWNFASKWNDFVFYKVYLAVSMELILFCTAIISNKFINSIKYTLVLVKQTNMLNYVPFELI